jgi:hypothetical protein
MKRIIESPVVNGIDNLNKWLDGYNVTSIVSFFNNFDEYWVVIYGSLKPNSKSTPDVGMNHKHSIAVINEMNAISGGRVGDTINNNSDVARCIVIVMKAHKTNEVDAVIYINKMLHHIWKGMKREEHKWFTISTRFRARNFSADMERFDMSHKSVSSDEIKKVY